MSDDAPLPAGRALGANRTLRAGPLQTRLIDGELRYVRVHGRELVRRVAVVVRDEVWGTLETELQAVDVESCADGFVVRVAARCRRGAIDVAWTARLEGTVGGTLDCAVELVAHGAFAYDRMGLVVLHPPDELTGRAFQAGAGADAVDGRLPVGVGPQHVADGLPQPLFPPFARLELPGDDSRPAQRLRFRGELFEMEDQRNWADGSFKTYAMPLREGFPRQAAEGEVRRQGVRIELDVAKAELLPAGRRDRDDAVAGTGATPTTGAQARPAAPLPGDDAIVRVALGARRGAVPAVGTLLPVPAPDDVTQALARLTPRHLRVDLAAGDDLSARLDAAAAAASGVPLELALRDAALIGPAAHACERLATPLARVLLLDGAAVAGDAARQAFPGVALAGGSSGHFADVNRAAPPGGLDGVAFALSPQTHLFDDDTLRESLESLEAVVQTARAVGGCDAVHVGPLTLRPQDGPGSEPRAGAPGATDSRQHTPFAAAWTLGAVAALGRAGASSLTAYEPLGPRGALACGDRSGPLADVLATLARYAGRPQRDVDVSRPLTLAVLVVETPGGSVDVHLANLTDASLRVRLDGLERELALGPYERSAVRADG